MAEGKLHETQTGGLTGPIMKAVRAVISQGSDQQLKSDGATTSTTTTSGGTGKYNNYASGRSDENLPILPPNLRESEVFPELAPDTALHRQGFNLPPGSELGNSKTVKPPRP